MKKNKGKKKDKINDPGVSDVFKRRIQLSLQFLQIGSVKQLQILPH